MDFLPWLLGALTVLVTQGVTLFADHRRRKWSEEGERRRRLEERSEQAALRLLDLMDEARGIFGTSGRS